MVNIFDRKHNFIKINKKNHHQNKVIIISVKKAPSDKQKELL